MTLDNSSRNTVDVPTSLNAAHEGPFRALVESVRDYAMFTLDCEGNVSSWNADAERFKGYQAHEIVGRHFSCFYPAEDVQASKPQHELSMAERNGQYADEGWRVRKDGVQFWASVIITALRDAQGNLIGFGKITRVRSERVHATEQFRLAIEAAPTGMIMVDRQGRIVLVNVQTERLFGYSRNELIGQPVEMLVPERFRARHPTFRIGFFHAPHARPMGAGRDLYGLRKDGTEAPIEIGLNPVSTPDGDFVLSSIVDITERVRATEQFRLAIEAAPTGMIMVDRQGYIVMVNVQTEKLFGYDREELVGKPVEMLVPQRFRERHPGFRSGFFNSPHTRPMGAGRDLFGLRKDLTEVPIEIGLNPLQTSDGDFVLSSIVDITERKRAEREREVLLQEIHHRVKNNLQVISSLINMQLRQMRQIREPNNKEALEECQARVQAIALIHEMLYRSKDYLSVPFSEYVRRLAGGVFNAAGVGQNAISLELELENIALHVDKAIPCGLILNELISNSLKHAFPNNRQGVIRVALRTLSDGRLCLEVKDNGIGIPANLDVLKSKSLGMQLVCDLAAQFKAALEVIGQDGALFRLTFSAE
ncbi:MAG TPA: PAS domain S-box protein [Burkholderiales bacterium]|nr:PAS domain S-box protein [Burkholderiales bacterium]